MKLLAGIFLIFLLGTMFVSLFNMSIGMNMTGEMSDCPFMSHEETWCPMDLADHIEAWQSAFLAVVPTAFLLLGITGILLVVTQAPHLLTRRLFYRRKLPRQLCEQNEGSFYHYIQELFSNGVLNPRSF